VTAIASWPVPVQNSWRRATGVGHIAPASGIWWLNPVLVTLVIPVPTVLVSLLFSDADFRRLWRSPRELTPETVALLIAGLLALCVGAAVAIALRPTFREGPYPLLRDAHLQLLLRSCRILLWATMIGYLAFVVQGIRVGISPHDLIAAFTDETVLSSFETRLTTVPGVSTFTQFGVAYVITSGLALPYVKGSPEHRRLQLGRVLVFGAAVIRSFYLTERLAVLELVVPLVAVTMVAAPFGSSLWRRMRTLPLILAPFVVAVFAGFEYTRSWAWYRSHTHTGFARFVLERFAGYYVTAYNNGQIRLDHEHRGGLPTATLELIWAAPGIKQSHLYEIITGISPMGDYDANLLHYGNPEFNNESGVVSPFVDFGIAGGIVYLALLGVLAGWLYARFGRRDPFGVLLYPVIFLTLLESPRYLWFAQGRATAPVVALIVIAVLLRRQGRERPNGVPGLATRQRRWIFR
jgi:oligosaccharide repeat unit polymerase